MASAKASAKYAAKAVAFAAKLKVKGHSCSFGVKTPGANDWDAPGGYSEIGEAPVFPSEWRADFSDDVRADDAMYLVGATVDITSSTHMRFDGVEHNVIKAYGFAPDGVSVVYYEMQVRGSGVYVDAPDAGETVGWNLFEVVGWNVNESIGWTL